MKTLFVRIGATALLCGAAWADPAKAADTGYPTAARAETVLRIRQAPPGGDLAQQFRSAISNDMLRALEEAEAELRCF